jgi:hypothetical protein
MPNIFDATLVNQVLAQKAVTYVQNKLAFLGAFTTDFSDEVRDIRSLVINVPVLSGTSAVQINPTNFETGDSYAFNAPVTMQHISKSFYLTPNDINTGSRLENLAMINMQAVTNRIEQAVFALITEANYGAPVAALSGITAGGLTVAQLKALWGTTPGDGKTAILKDNEYANVLPSDTNGFDVTRTNQGYGFDYLGRSGNGFSFAGTKIVGFGATRGAIAMAAAIPQYHSAVADLMDSTVVEVPGLGLSIQSNVWGSTASRSVWASYDLLFGASAADKSALKLVKTL